MIYIFDEMFFVCAKLANSSSFFSLLSLSLVYWTEIIYFTDWLSQEFVFNPN